MGRGICCCEATVESLGADSGEEPGASHYSVRLQIRSHVCWLLATCICAALLVLGQGFMFKHGQHLHACLRSAGAPSISAPLPWSPNCSCGTAPYMTAGPGKSLARVPSIIAKRGSTLGQWEDAQCADVMSEDDSRMLIELKEALLDRSCELLRKEAELTVKFNIGEWPPL